MAETSLSFDELPRTLGQTGRELVEYLYPAKSFRCRRRHSDLGTDLIRPGRRSRRFGRLAQIGVHRADGSQRESTRARFWGNPSCSPLTSSTPWYRPSGYRIPLGRRDAEGVRGPAEPSWEAWAHMLGMPAGTDGASGGSSQKPAFVMDRMPRSIRRTCSTLYSPFRSLQTVLVSRFEKMVLDEYEER